LIPNVANGEAIATIMLGTDQLARVAKVGKLYATAPAISGTSTAPRRR